VIFTGRSKVETSLNIFPLQIRVILQYFFPRSTMCEKFQDILDPYAETPDAGPTATFSRL